MTADDFFSGTVAAAVGGTTSIIDFPVQEKGQDPRESHGTGTTARRQGRRRLGPAPGDRRPADELLPPLTEPIEGGSPSFKLFMAYPGARMVDDATIFKAMRHAGEHGGFVLMHAENGPVIQLLEEEALAAGHTTPPGARRPGPP